MAVRRGYTLPGLAGDAKSYAERLFEFPLIDSLSDADAAQALTRPAIERGVLYSDAAVAGVLSITQGYPYFLAFTVPMFDQFLLRQLPVTP